MKKCEGCGAYYSDFDRVCPHCGRADETMPEEKREAPVQLKKEKPMPDDAEQEASRAYSYGNTASPYDREPETAPGVSPAAYSRYSLKWHRFLMVVMIIGAVLTIISAFTLLSGSAYLSQGVDAERVYSVYPGMKSIDIMYAVASMAIGVFQIVVRNRLNGFRKNAPKLLLVLYGVALLANVIYLFSVASVLQARSGDAAVEVRRSSITQLVALGIYAAINGVYYNKRKSLFVN